MNIVFEMKSLILLLFLGAVVFTLAEEPVEDEAVQEYLDEEEDETITELADEENDPRRRPRPSRRPSRKLVRWVLCVESSGVRRDNRARSTRKLRISFD